jgi:hypothetical protein
MLSEHDPDANAEFIASVLLDPLAAKSRFLVKRTPQSGDPLDAVYELTAQEDLAGTLRRRIEKAMADIGPNDSRPLLEPLAELQPGISWPGPEVLRECAERTVQWRQTTRRALVVFIHEGEEKALAERIDDALTNGRADFCVAITAGARAFHCRYATVWRFSAPKEGGNVLHEYFAAKTVARELQPANPAHAPLIPLVNDHLRRLEPAAAAALMESMYAGSFDDRELFVDPSAIQIRRFDRLLEAAGARILEERYPRFKEIASRLLQPSSRLYQRIIDEFVVPGTISMSEARAASLTEAIETLAAPLGLVDVKSGSYRFAPALGEHAFLSYVFSLLRPAGPTPLADVCVALKSGPWGVPPETVEFLLVALACSGAIMLLRSGRPVALDLLSIAAASSADSIAPGEIVPAADRDTIVNECPFLAPQGGWPVFGLRQQREAWQALVKMKASSETMLDGISGALRTMEEFEAFSTFDFEAVEDAVRRFASVLEEIKVSYPAREGIERFCAAWRASRLIAADVDGLKQTNRFFSRFADKFIFIAHYLRHRSVEQACVANDGIASRREALALMLKDPHRLVVADEGAQFGAAFDLFREEYACLYATKHREFYEAQRPRKLDRLQQRMLDLFDRLARVEQLDRPQGLDALLRLGDRNASPACDRPVMEELLRSSACGCGFTFGTPLPPSTGNNQERLFERVLNDYQTILATPGVVEAVSAHAFALRDMDASLATRLEKLCVLLRKKDGAPASSLVDLLDEKTVSEIQRALSGSVSVIRKPLSTLVAELSGRRLSPSKVRNAFNHWLTENDESTLLSIDAPVLAEGGVTAARPLWWQMLHPELDLHAPSGSLATPEEATELESRLEAHYPSSTLEKQFAKMDPAGLARFIVSEPFHTRAIQAAWTALLDTCLRRHTGGFPELPRSRHCASKAAVIDGRMAALRAFLNTHDLPFPQRLRGRVHAAALWSDEWTTRDLRKNIEAAMAGLEKQAGDWHAALQALSPLVLSVPVIVIIIDALPPDVWLEALPQCGPLLDRAKQEWSRLTVPPYTVSALAALFGFAPDRDPLDEFAVRGVRYHTITGDEEHSLIDLIPPVAEPETAVVRINLLDVAAHGAKIPLHAFPSHLCAALSRHLPAVISLCKKQKRRLILTADHGLSWTAGTLSHGRGGVFEDVVPRVEWEW